MAPEVEVTKIKLPEDADPVVSVLRAMLPPALIVISPPTVVRLPSAATSATSVPAFIVIVPPPVVAIVSSRLRKTTDPSVALMTSDQPFGMVAVPALPFWPRYPMVTPCPCGAVMVTVVI